MRGLIEPPRCARRPDEALGRRACWFARSARSLLPRLVALRLVGHPQHEVLDHRVGEALVGDLAGPVKVGVTVELEIDALADAHRADVRDAEARQRVDDSLTLRVENFWFEHDV